VVSSAYIPPNSSTHIYESYLSAVQSVINDNPDCIFLFCGDFNLPDITWSNDNLGITFISKKGLKIHCLPETFAFLNYFQINHVQNFYGKLLDLVFCNSDIASVETVSDTLVPCDLYHPALCINISIGSPIPLPGNSHKFFNIRRACYSDINNFVLSFNWYDTFLSLDVDSATNTFYDALHYCIFKFVPEVSYLILLLNFRPGSQKT